MVCLWSSWLLLISAGAMTLPLFLLKRMMGVRPRTRILLALFSLLSLAGLMLIPARAVVMYEYGMAGISIPWGITVDKDGALWITEQGANKIAKLSGSTIYEWSIPTSGSVPWGITCSKDHADIWFTEETTGKIGKFVPSPAPGKFYEWELPSPTEARPRGITMNITKMSATGKVPLDDVWFTEFGRNRIGHLYRDPSLPPADTSIRFTFYTIPLPAAPPPDNNVQPLSIAMSPIDYSIWFTEYATGRIGSIKLLENGDVIFRHYETTSTSSKPWGIAVDPDGFVWVTESANPGCLGRLNPTTGEYVTFTVPTLNAEPRELAIEATTSPPYRVVNVWFTEYKGNKIGRYDPGLNVFFEYPIITAEGGPHGITVTGPGGNVWFTEPFVQKVGLLSQTNPRVTSTTVGTITSAATTSTTVATTRTTTASVPALTTAVIASVGSAAVAVTVVTTTYTFTSTKLYMTSTSIYSRTATSRSTSYTTTTTTTTSTQVVVSTSTLPTTTTTTATSTSWNVQSSTLSTSRTNTIVLVSTSSTTTALTATSTSISPTASITLTNTSVVPTTTFSPTVTVTSVQTSVIPTTSVTTSILTTTITTTTTVAVTRPCIIASAVYGSELAPEVQFLREFRDGSVISTFAGAQFMKAFNAFYYSFSPSVAQLVSASPYVSTALRAAIYPLLTALNVSALVFRILSLNPETAILLAGILASCLIGAIYAFPAVVLLELRAKKRKPPGGT